MKHPHINYPEFSGVEWLTPEMQMLFDKAAQEENIVLRREYLGKAAELRMQQ